MTLSLAELRRPLEVGGSPELRKNSCEMEPDRRLRLADQSRDERSSEVALTNRKFRLVGGEAVYDLGQKPETVSEQARRLHREAQVLAAEEVDLLRRSLADGLARAQAVCDGGEIFPVGVREQARQLTATLPQVLRTLQALTERHLRQVTGDPTPAIWRGEP